jgi:hypothetical protein
MLKPAAPYVLNDDEFRVFASTIKNIINFKNFTIFLSAKLSWTHHRPQ